MTMTTKNRIFLAHASEDKPQVRQLYNDLKARGFDPWLDDVDLIPGKNWREEIPKAIKNAAVCLACLSKRSVEKKSYVQREFRYAFSAYADLPPGTIYLIPVRLDDCEVPDLRIAELELNLRDLHWVDLFAESGFEKLVGAIELNVDPAPAPSSQQLNSVEFFKDMDAPWCPELVMLPAGSFMMGSPKSEKGRFDNEGPQHEVTISRPFALGRYPVTFAEYDYFCDQTVRKKPYDQGWGRGRRPVIHVSHKDAEAYCVWLSGVTKATYQLPSEAMWEYGCRAGTTTAYAFGDELTKDRANFGELIGKTNQVGAYPANGWGLHDMHGNVYEWCADWYYEDYKGTPADGSVRRKSIIGYRVVRGGSWINSERHARSAYRDHFGHLARNVHFGFRCVRDKGA